MSNPPTLSTEEQPEEITRFVQWYGSHPDKSESTATRYRTALRKWAVWCKENDVPLLEADSRDVERFLLGLHDEYAPKTVSNTRAALSQFYQRMGDYEEGETPVDNADVGTWNAESVKSEARRESVHWLNPDQVEELIDSVPAPTLRNRLLVKLMVQTGVRASEVATIRLSDVDTDKRTVRVKDKKSDGSRVVVYQPTLDRLLGLWLDVERDTVYGAAESPYLFPTKQSDHIHPQRVNSIVKESASNAGIQRVYAETADGRERAEITSHVLRHTFAMNALRNGMDTRWLQMAMGHDSIETTTKYLRANEEDLVQAWRDDGPAF